MNRHSFRTQISRRTFLGGWLPAAAVRAASPLDGRTVLVAPNFHPASCGWLTDFSKERVYCANSYFDHLDRVRDDPHYAFALSEVNNIIAMMNFQPGRMEELRRRIREGRVELVNGFFLESTINLSGGEALVRLGVEGLRWQQAMFGVRPRFAWTIDVCGTHDQMAQITTGLGLDAMVYTRMNSTGSALHWAESPDGTRALAISPGHYAELRTLMGAKEPLDIKGLAALRKQIEAKIQATPEGAPILILAGSGDYSLAPLVKQYPKLFLEQWKQFAPRVEIRFVTPGQYLDTVLPALRSGSMKLPVMRGGTEYNFLSFWIQNPRVKTWFRKNEHLLQAAEMFAAAASLWAGYRYPVQTLYHAWLQTCLNMDRNTLWGAAGGMVFEHDKSWDVRDRLEWVEKESRAVWLAACRALTKPGGGVALANPLNWRRSDPAVFDAGAGVETLGGQRLPDGRLAVRLDLPSCGIRAISGAGQLAASNQVALPETIRTKYYEARMDASSGALVSLKLRASGREMLGGPCNVIVAERPVTQRADPGDHMQNRESRVRVHSSNQSGHAITVWSGPVATVVQIEGRFFGGSPCRRVVRFYNDHPRIDFETELNDIPDRTVVVAEFPLAGEITEVRRGIPYGFSHGAWAKPNPNLAGWTRGIVPAVRWSHYSLAWGGVALFDRGLSGRELTGNVPVVFLYNATDKYRGYPNAWLSGKGRHLLEYALVAHEGEWKDAGIVQMAWEYNAPPAVIAECAAAPARSFLETSGNVVVEAMRREGSDVELRFVECLGYAGTAEIHLGLPHKDARLTDMTGEHARPLSGGPRYKIPVRPQQIVTMRFRTVSAVEPVQPLTDWEPLVPPAKRAALREYTSDKGHPPRG